jgi:hypothetical protein
MGVLRTIAAWLLLAAAALSAHAADVTLVEYYNASLGHYFMTSYPAEIAVLDSHALPGWARTGLAFDAYDAASHPASARAICRMYNDHYNGTSSHFYGTRDAECALTRQLFPDWTYEAPEFFDADVPDAAGACPPGQYQVYRMFNNGIGGAPNHRFTNSPDVVTMMVAKGYANEGVHWCTTSPPPAVLPSSHADGEGLWRGTTAAGQGFDVLVLADGTLEIAYSSPGTKVYAGSVRAIATLAANGFSASDAQDLPGLSTSTPRFGFGGDVTAMVVGETLTLASGMASVTAAYDATYDQPASLAAVAGSHSGALGHVVVQGSATITIGADGSLLVYASECDYAGTVTPRADAAVFDAVLRATRGPCKTVPDLIAGVRGVMFHSTAMQGYVATFRFANTVTGTSGDLLYFVAN